MKILISGWYGYENIGDEIILYAIHNRYKKIHKNAEIIGCSSNPKYTFNQLGIKSIQQIPVGKRELLKSIFNLSIFKVLFHLVTCDLFILGGGGFLSDWQIEAPKDWLRKIKLVKIINPQVKVHVFGIGAGPFISDSGKNYVKNKLEKYADEITVRDYRSYYELKSICKISKNINIEIDPVAKYFNYSKKFDEEFDLCLIVKDNFTSKYWSDPINNKKRSLLFECYKKIINLSQAKKINLLVISLHSNHETEILCYLEKIAYENMTIIKSNNVFEIIDLIAKSSKVISMRLHGNILAYVLNKPFLPIVYHFKTYEFLKMIGFDFLINDVLFCGDGINWDDISPDPVMWEFLVCKFIEKNSNEYIIKK